MHPPLHVAEGVLRAYALRRPRWAKRQNQEAERPRQLPHILSGIELDMDLDAIQREGFEPAEDTIAEDPLKPSPFDAGAHPNLFSPFLHSQLSLRFCDRHGISVLVDVLRPALIKYNSPLGDPVSCCCQSPGIGLPALAFSGPQCQHSYQH